MMILRYIEGHLPNRRRRSAQPNNDPVTARLFIEKLARKVRREAHRVKGFVRFRQFGDNCFLALINPRYDVLPLVRHHFEARFADQKWILYDTGRNYGLSYESRGTKQVRLDAEEIAAFSNAAESGDILLETLWQRYYAATNIRQRKNRGLHVRMLPRRFWRYLPEKNSPL